MMHNQNKRGKYLAARKPYIWVHSMSTYMASINISLRKEAYEFLKKIKTKDKSFSDVVLSFKKGQGDAMQFFGV